MKKLFLLLLPIALLSCSSDDDSAPTVTDPDLNANAFIKGSMDGTDFNFKYEETTFQYLFMPVSTYSYSDDFTKLYNYGGKITSVSNFQNSIAISFNRMFAGNDVQETAAFYDSVATFPGNFLTEAQDDSHVKGIVIVYTSPEGKIYSSLYGSQTGSALAVDNSTSETEQESELQLKNISGTFNCKLYNPDNTSEMITIANGSYKITLKEY